MLFKKSKKQLKNKRGGAVNISKDNFILVEEDNGEKLVYQLKEDFNSETDLTVHVFDNDKDGYIDTHSDKIITYKSNVFFQASNMAIAEEHYQSQQGKDAEGGMIKNKNKNNKRRKRRKANKIAM